MPIVILLPREGSGPPDPGDPEAPPPGPTTPALAGPETTTTWRHLMRESKMPEAESVGMARVSDTPPPGRQSLY